MSNDFEKKAKQLGDDFKLQPRDNVWLRIEESLNEKKRRRVAWWWWAAPVALLLGSGIWFYASQQAETNKLVTLNNTGNKTAGSSASKSNVSDPAPTSKPIPQNQTSSTDHPQTATVQPKRKQAGSTVTDTHIEPTLSKNNHKKSNQNNSKQYSYGLDLHTSQTHSSTRTASNSQVQQAQAVVGSEISTTTTDQQVLQESKNSDQPAAVHALAEPNVTNTTADATSIASNVQTANNTTSNIAIDKKEENTVGSNPVVNVTALKSGVTEDKNKKKATWLIQAGAGMSNMGDIVQLPGAKAASADQASNSFNPSVIVSTPSRNDKAGWSFGLGIQRKQNISKRWQWSASLAWQYQQIQQYKGVKIDSAISITASGSNLSSSYYYTNGSNATERGSNHRVVLNNELSWQVIKNHPLLRLGGGLYTGYNIASNYYVEDNMQRLVKNDGLYSKWFLGFAPSLQFELKNNIKINMNTYIDFTKAYKELNGNPKYWKGWEVRADVPLFNK